jgi:hypothetical protein
MKFIPATALAAAIAVISAATAVTAPPKPAEISRQWQLDVKFEKPMPIQVALAGEASARTFWYMRYTVTNRTGGDRIFVPEFILYTDTGQILRAGHKVPTSVFQDVKALYNDPLLLDVSAMSGKLLQGADNAKEGVAIWPDFDGEAGAFDVFVSGLSGETMEMKLPKPIRVNETDIYGKTREIVKDRIILSKTLKMHFSVPGEAAARLSSGMKLDGETWVMR